jgi:anti-anti-sigma factor
MPKRIVLDLRDVTFLDLTALRAILRVNERGRAEGLEVAVIRPRGFASRIFTLTRAGDQLSMVDERDAA